MHYARHWGARWGLRCLDPPSQIISVFRVDLGTFFSVELQGGACAPPGQGRIKAGRLQVRASSFPTLAQGSPRSRAALPAKLPWVPGQPDGGIFFIEMAHLLSASPCNSHRLCPLCLPCFLRLLHLLHLLPVGAQESHFAS